MRKTSELNNGQTNKKTNRTNGNKLHKRNIFYEEISFINIFSKNLKKNRTGLSLLWIEIFELKKIIKALIKVSMNVNKGFKNIALFTHIVYVVQNKFYIKSNF